MKLKFWKWSTWRLSDIPDKEYTKRRDNKKSKNRKRGRIAKESRKRNRQS